MGADLGAWEAELLQLFDAGGLTVVGLLGALAVGIGHAMAPGHGKTLSAAYLAGTRGRLRDAVLLGAAVAAMHTASVAALALAWWSAGGLLPQLDGVTNGLGVMTGILVAAVGVTMLLRHRGHAHDHGGDRGLPDRTATHDPQDPVDPNHHFVARSRSGIAAMAALGGLVPSPSAFLVLVTGLATGQAWRAMAFLTAFAVGMALTVALLGTLVMRGRVVLEARAGGHHFTRLLALIPRASAVAVVLGGVLVATTSASDLLRG